MRRILLATLLTILLLPSLSYAAAQKPAFFDSIKSQKDMDALSDTQKTELRAYLSASALENVGSVINIDSLDLSLDTSTYSKGDTVTASLTLVSPMLKGYADTHQGEQDTQKILTLNLGLTSQDGTPCIEPLEKTFPVSDLNPTFDTKATSDCDHPKASVSLSDWNKNDLGRWEINTPGVIPVKDTPVDLTQTPSDASNGISVTTGVIALVVVLFLVSIGLIASKRVGGKRRL